MKTDKTRLQTQFFMPASNAFDFNNWLQNDGGNGSETGDDAKIANNNFVDSPDRGDPHSITLLGATIFEVKTPQNAALVGQNKCIDDGAIGVYGRSDGTTHGIGVTGACDQDSDVGGIATSATADLLPASTAVYGAGDFHGVYGVERCLRGSTPDLSVVAPSHPAQQPDVAVVGADEDSSTAQAPAILGLEEIIAKPLRKPLGKSIWMPVGILCLALVVVAYAARNSATALAGLGVGKLICIELILFLSGLMSGLSGFGFSAGGAGCLLFIEPITEAPLLQTLSTGNQLLSLKQLREDMPKSWKGFWEGPGFCILGGLPGAFVGIWMLSHLPAEQLMKIFGALLILYSIYSMFKPAGAKIRGFDGPVTGAIVGFIGGAIGGFSAFPGAAVVVWTSLRDLPKAQNRAIVQPYIIMSQIFSLILIALLHSNYLSYHYWLLLLMTLPAVLPGTATGVMLYRRISDVNFKRVSYLLLGLSGVALLLKTYGPILARLF